MNSSAYTPISERAPDGHPSHNNLLGTINVMARSAIEVKALSPVNAV